jgi:O-antigen/teichoic acid export membrane protein
MDILRRFEWRAPILAWRSSLYTNSFYLMASSVVNAGFGFLFWTTGARLYTPQELGVAAAAVSAMAFLALLSVFGIDYAIVRFLPDAVEPHRMINTSVTAGATAGLGLSLVFVAGLGFWAPALLPLQRNAVFLVTFMVATACSTVVAIVANVFLSRRRSDLVLAQSLIFGATKFFCAVALAYASQTLGLFAAWTLASFAAALACAMFLPVVEGGHYRFRPSMRIGAINDMTLFALSNYAAAVLWTAPAALLPLLVINIAGPEANAYFYVAWSVSSLLTMIPTAVAQSLFAHASADERELPRHLRDGLKLTLSFVIPAIAIVWLAGGRVLLLFGKAYSQQATVLLRVLALSTLPMTVNFFFFSVRRVQKQVSGIIASTLWILVVTLGLSAFLLPRIGLMGTGIAWGVAQGTLAVLILTMFLLR